MQVNILRLKDKRIIGQGTNRACYVHPEDNAKCIKVTISGDQSESNKEKKYYEFLKNKNISWKQIARYHGSVKTDLGEGSVFDLVRDFDGKVSKTLEYYIYTEEGMSVIRNPVELLHEFKAYQLEEKVIIKDLNTKNILCRLVDENNAELIVVDGVINNEFIPLANIIDYFAIKKILRRWKVFSSALVIHPRFKDLTGFQKMLKDHPL